MKWIKTLTHDGEVCSAWCGVYSTGEMTSGYVGRWSFVVGCCEFDGEKSGRGEGVQCKEVL